VVVVAQLLAKAPAQAQAVLAVVEKWGVLVLLVTTPPFLHHKEIKAAILGRIFHLAQVAAVVLARQEGMAMQMV
jgi:hypothetical protein